MKFVWCVRHPGNGRCLWIEFGEAWADLRNAWACGEKAWVYPKLIRSERFEKMKEYQP